MNDCRFGAFDLLRHWGAPKGTLMETKSLWLALALIGSSGIMAGCEQKTPMQKAGEDLKDAAHDAGSAIKDAGRDAKDAAKDAGQDLKKATDGKPN